MERKIIFAVFIIIMMVMNSCLSNSEQQYSTSTNINVSDPKKDNTSQSTESQTTNKTNIDSNVIAQEYNINNASTPKMKTYSNNLYSVSYPSDWLCAEHPNDFVDVAFGQQVGIAFSIFHVDIDATLSEIVNSGNNDMKTQLGANVLSNNKIKLCNIDAYKTVFRFYTNGIDCKQISYTLKKGATYYNIRFNGGVIDIDYNKDLIETIIQTFELKTN